MYYLSRMPTSASVKATPGPQSRVRGSLRSLATLSFLSCLVVAEASHSPCPCPGTFTACLSSHGARRVLQDTAGRVRPVPSASTANTVSVC